MADIGAALSILAGTRPVFHSEADFQHALAWVLHEQDPKAVIRLEWRPPHLTERAYIDLCVDPRGQPTAIELKYTTRALNLDIGGETFDLLSQGAQDVRRYDFLKDIQRLEHIVASLPGAVGHAIFLTNDSTYWTPPVRDGVAYAAFSMHEGRVLTGVQQWGPTAGAGTTNGRDKPIALANTYRLLWRDYWDLDEGPGRRFRYLQVKVEAASP